MPKGLRNAGPNGDSARDLLSDAIGMLEVAETLAQDPGYRPELMQQRIKEVIGVLRELEVTQAA